MEVDITQVSKVILISVLLFFLGTLSLKGQVSIKGYDHKAITIYKDTLFALGIAGRPDSVIKDTSGVFHFQSDIGNYVIDCYFDTVLAGGVFPDVIKIDFHSSDSANVGGTAFTDDSVAYWSHDVSKNDSIYSYPVDTMAVWYRKDDLALPVCRYGRFVVTVDTAFSGASKYFFFIKLKYQ